MNIEENNKLIAQFQFPRWVKPTMENDIPLDISICNNDYAICLFLMTDNYLKLAYHSDWSYLMPVVEKIETDTPFSNNLYKAIGYTVIIDGKSCKIEEDSYTPIVHIIDNESEKINIVYRAVVEFIKWYNKKKDE